MLIYLLGGCRGQGPLIQGLVGWLAASVLQPAHCTYTVGTGHARDQSTPVPLILALYQQGLWSAYLFARRRSRTWSAYMDPPVVASHF